MARQQIPLGSILGIPVGLDYSWFLIFALLTALLANSYYPAEFSAWPQPLYWFMGAVTALLFFASVLLHELGHSLIALMHRIRVRSITLHIFGGIAEIADEPPSAAVEFQVAMAGPLTSFILAGIFYALKPLLTSVQPLLGLAEYLAYINLSLALFNLVPGYPLDGGRVFRSLVWAVTGSMRRATVIAANVGRGFAFLFIFLGLWQFFSGNPGGGLWIAFIGWFLNTEARAELMRCTVNR